jgi:hypothetical protein
MQSSAAPPSQIPRAGETERGRDRHDDERPASRSVPGVLETWFHNVTSHRGHDMITHHDESPAGEIRVFSLLGNVSESSPAALLLFFFHRHVNSHIIYLHIQYFRSGWSG